jgi:hypothetical protein
MRNFGDFDEAYQLYLVIMDIRKKYIDDDILEYARNLENLSNI